jgi:hypothetical protein
MLMSANFPFFCRGLKVRRVLNIDNEDGSVLVLNI